MFVPLHLHLQALCQSAGVGVKECNETGICQWLCTDLWCRSALPVPISRVPTAVSLFGAAAWNEGSCPSELLRLLRVKVNAAGSVECESPRALTTKVALCCALPSFPFLLMLTFCCLLPSLSTLQLCPSFQPGRMLESHAGGATIGTVFGQC